MAEQVPAYTIISIQDTSAHDPVHGMMRHKRVNVRFADGTTSYVEVPITTFNADHVAEELQNAADAHAEVLSIQGPLIDNPTVTGQSRGSRRG